MNTRKTTPGRARVAVSRAEEKRRCVSGSAQSIRDRLRSGAREISVITTSDAISLGDADFADSSGQSWVIRFLGKSEARIFLSAPLPDRCQIVATDGSFVEVSGCAVVHAYTRASVHAFDAATVHARNRSAVSACNFASVRASDDAIVDAYDETSVRAGGRACVTAMDHSSVHLTEDAHAWVRRGVRVTGPGRANVSLLSPDKQDLS